MRKEPIVEKNFDDEIDVAAREFPDALFTRTHPTGVPTIKRSGIRRQIGTHATVRVNDCTSHVLRLVCARNRRTTNMFCVAIHTKARRRFKLPFKRVVFEFLSVV